MRQDAAAGVTNRGAIPAGIVSALALSLGSTLWMTYVAWPATGNLVPLIVGGLIFAAIAGAVSIARPPLIGSLLVLGPVVLAPGTASRGDEDGLWALIFLVLAGVGVLFGIAARIGGSLGKVTPHVGEPALRAMRVVAAASVLVALTITVAEWPRPHAEIDRAFDRLDLAEFTRLDSNRSGRALSTAAPPSVSWLVGSDLPVDAACDALRAALARSGVLIRETKRDCSTTGDFEAPSKPFAFIVGTDQWAPRTSESRFYVLVTLIEDGPED